MSWDHERMNSERVNLSDMSYFSFKGWNNWPKLTYKSHRYTTELLPLWIFYEGIPSSLLFIGLWNVMGISASKHWWFSVSFQRTAMRLYFMEFNTRGRDGLCESPTDDFLTIEGKARQVESLETRKTRRWGAIEVWLTKWPFDRLNLLTDWLTVTNWVAEQILY